MPIPDFQSLMLPLLKHFADGQDHANQEILDAMAGASNLTEEERAQIVAKREAGGFYQSNCVGEKPSETSGTYHLSATWNFSYYRSRP